MRTENPEHRHRLVVVLHGLKLPLGVKVNAEAYKGILTLFLTGDDGRGLADLLLVDYPNHFTVKPEVAQSLSPSIGAAIESIQGDYDSVTLLGHSFGSLLARRVLVDAAQENQQWCSKALGLIVLSGANLGFKIQKTDDLGVRAFGFLAGLSDKLCPWLADAFVYGPKWGVLLSNAWRNSAWMIDTRIKWLRLYEGNSTFLRGGSGSIKEFKTLYILGLKDQLVGPDDLQMVYQYGDYCCVRTIAGAYHQDFLDAPRGRQTVAERLKSESEDWIKIKDDLKTIFAEIKPDLAKGWQKIERVSQLHREGVLDQGSERSVVFLIHGIRDNAEWQEDIDYNLRKLHQNQSPPAAQQSTNHRAIHISQVRYGYFNALQFLFPSERKRAVRSFSDEYLRVMARFPDLKQENIHVYAHSNGTFVFGQALKKYEEIKVNRVLMGGSVLPVDFPWKRFVNSRGSGGRAKQVLELLNYAADQDWPTGFLCRGLSYLPGMDGPLLGVGPGGTDGFKDLRKYKQKVVGDVRGWNFYLRGGHGATLEPGNAGPLRIAEYLLGDPIFSEEDLDGEGKDPFQSKTYLKSQPSIFRGGLGTILAATALVVFVLLLLFLLGLLFPLVFRVPFHVAATMILIYLLSRF